eukprot:11195280-Lingulodinium_polyedra.AAC.1
MATTGFPDVSKALLVKVLLGEKLNISAGASEFEEVKAACKHYCPNMDEATILLFMSGRKHAAGGRLSDGSFFSDESVQACFDEGDLDEVTKTCESYLPGKSAYEKAFKENVKKFFSSSKAATAKTRRGKKLSMTDFNIEDAKAWAPKFLPPMS